MRPVSKMAQHLVDPAKRNAYYGKPLNVAQYLVDLHDSQQVFNFCGCLLFQLCLSAKLRAHLGKVAEQGVESPLQPRVFDASKNRMCRIAGYAKSAGADNVEIFHGREIRSAGAAKGGQGCVLHLSLAQEDPEGWTAAEISDYNGWGSDRSRPWRKANQLAAEGFPGYAEKFGSQAYGLHHRFYLHWDRRDAFWLSAEDGCEGEPCPAPK